MTRGVDTASTLCSQPHLFAPLSSLFQNPIKYSECTNINVINTSQIVYLIYHHWSCFSLLRQVWEWVCGVEGVVCLVPPLVSFQKLTDVKEWGLVYKLLTWLDVKNLELIYLSYTQFLLPSLPSFCHFFHKPWLSTYSTQAIAV